MKEDEDNLLENMESYRRTLFIGVTLSSTALLSSVICIPLLFFHIQSLQTTLSHELHFCTMRTHDLWDELKEVERSIGVQSRIKRQSFLPSDTSSITFPYLRNRDATYRTTTVRPVETTANYRYRDLYQDELRTRPAVTVRPVVEIPRQQVVDNRQYFEQPQQIRYAPRVSSSICVFGPPGPPGFPGMPGRDGQDGFPGGPGAPAPDYGNERMIMPEITVCQKCAPAVPGRPGRPGSKGMPGQPGMPGQSYFAPKNPPGPPGAIGLPGLTGRPGMPGMRGVPGVLVGEEVEVGLPGPPGAPGPRGRSGDPGIPGNIRYGMRGPSGDPGKAGEPGTPGSKGGIGPRGLLGARGRCDHCPMPQLAPGYR